MESGCLDAAVSEEAEGGNVNLNNTYNVPAGADIYVREGHDEFLQLTFVQTHLVVAADVTVEQLKAVRDMIDDVLREVMDTPSPSADVELIQAYRCGEDPTALIEAARRLVRSPLAPKGRQQAHIAPAAAREGETGT